MVQSSIDSTQKKGVKTEGSISARTVAFNKNYLVIWGIYSNVIFNFLSLSLCHDPRLRAEARQMFLSRLAP